MVFVNKDDDDDDDDDEILTVNVAGVSTGTILRCSATILKVGGQITALAKIF
jgi:hypothetical protein